MVWCLCSCHSPNDEEREDDSTFSGVPMLDPVALHTARPCCSADHWKAFYLATEPKKPAAREKVPVGRPAVVASGRLEGHLAPG